VVSPERLLKNIRDVFQDRGMEFVRVNRLKAYTILEAEGQAVAGYVDAGVKALAGTSR